MERRHTSVQILDLVNYVPECVWALMKDVSDYTNEYMLVYNSDKPKFKIIITYNIKKLKPELHSVDFYQNNIHNKRLGSISPETLDYYFKDYGITNPDDVFDQFWDQIFDAIVCQLGDLESAKKRLIHIKEGGADYVLPVGIY